MRFSRARIARAGLARERHRARARRSSRVPPRRGFLTADGVSDNNLVFEKLHHGVNMPPNPRDVRFVVRRMANRRAQNELNRLHAKADYGYGGAVNGSGYDGRAELQRLAELEEQQNADDNRRLHRTPVRYGAVVELHHVPRTRVFFRGATPSPKKITPRSARARCCASSATRGRTRARSTSS